MTSRSLLRPLLRASRVPSTSTARLSTTPCFSAYTPVKPKPYVPRSQTSSPFSKSAKPTDPESVPEDTAENAPSTTASDDREVIDIAAAQQLVSPSPYPSAPPTEIDWTRSTHGLGQRAFPKEVASILTQTIDPADIEVKPDGIIYLPEIKYRRILNAAFGPGGWGLVPRGEAVVGERIVTREYALVADGRFISQAQGENQYFALEGLPAAVEGCKSNALMRCCKDVGVASELWDPVYIRQFRTKHVEQVWVEHVTTKKKKLLWNKKGLPIGYPFKKT